MNFHAFWVSADHRVRYFATAVTADVENLSFVNEALGDIFQIHFHHFYKDLYTILSWGLINIQIIELINNYE